MAYTVPAPVQPEKEYLGPAELARLIRASLRRHFPRTTFYVRAKSYAGGGSVDIYYDGLLGWAPLSACHCAEGPSLSGYPGDENRCTRCGYLGTKQAVYRPHQPTAQRVNDVAKAFQGAAFDGMIDMGYNVDVYLDADGEPIGGSSPGTMGSMGLDPSYETHMDGLPRGARRVRSSCYVFVTPELPYDVRSKR